MSMMMKNLDHQRAEEEESNGILEKELHYTYSKRCKR